MEEDHPYRKNEHADAPAVPAKITFEALADDMVFWSACVLKRLGRDAASSPEAAKFATQVADQVVEMRRQRFGRVR